MRTAHEVEASCSALALVWPRCQKKTRHVTRLPKSRRSDIRHPQKITRRNSREFCAPSTHDSAIQSHLIASPGPRLARLWRAMATTMDNDANDGEMDDDNIYIYIQYMQSLLFKCGEEGKANHQPEKNKQETRTTNRQNKHRQTRDTRTHAHTHPYIHALAMYTLPGI